MDISTQSAQVKPFQQITEGVDSQRREVYKEIYEGLNWLYENKRQIDLGDYDIKKDENGVLTVSCQGKAVANLTPDGEYRETQHATPADRSNISGMGQLGNQATLGQSTGESSLSAGVFLSETIKLIIESLKRFLEFARNQNDAEQKRVEDRGEMECE